MSRGRAFRRAGPHSQPPPEKNFPGKLPSLEPTQRYDCRKRYDSSRGKCFFFALPIYYPQAASLTAFGNSLQSILRSGLGGKSADANLAVGNAHREQRRRPGFLRGDFGRRRREKRGPGGQAFRATSWSRKHWNAPASGPKTSRKSRCPALRKNNCQNERENSR